jgi:hypothetical protein
VKLTRNLTLTSPLMRGEDVRMVQEALDVPVDGEFGPVTAGAAKLRKYELGMQDSQVRASVTTGEWPFISGERQPGAFMKANQLLRKPKPSDSALAADRMKDWYTLLYRETPSGSNRVEPLAKLAKATGLSDWYQRMGWPWCAFAVFLAGRAVNHKDGPQKDGFAGRFNALYVPDILTRAEHGQFGMRVVPDKDAKPGDLVVFNWDGGVPDHIGRFLSFGPMGLVSVEGNTSYDASGSQSNGGAVAIRNRAWRNVQAIIREG